MWYRCMRYKWRAILFCIKLWGISSPLTKKSLFVFLKHQEFRTLLQKSDFPNAKSNEKETSLSWRKEKDGVRNVPKLVGRQGQTNDPISTLIPAFKLLCCNYINILRGDKIAILCRVKWWIRCWLMNTVRGLYTTRTSVLKAPESNDRFTLINVIDFILV